MYCPYGLSIRTVPCGCLSARRPDLIDPALLRPGRFDRLVYVPPPRDAGTLMRRLPRACDPETQDKRGNRRDIRDMRDPELFALLRLLLL